MEEIRIDKDLILQVIATGMHLSAEFGLTYKEIEKDGFMIDRKIVVILSSDTPIGISKSMGLGMISFAEAYQGLNPDIIVVLGDRFEIFSAVAAALIGKIPVAHISGGEVTEGAFDDAIRHCITKMSHLHFTSTQEYRKRVIQLGEHPNRVFDVGALGLDSIRMLNLLSKKELERKLHFTFNKHNVLVTFHPATLDNNAAHEQFGNLLNVIDGLADTNIIFTKANADPEGRVINRMIDGYVARNYHKAVVFASMGQLYYLSALQYVDFIAGNSSSGITEAPNFRVGTINIGDRQKGRIKSVSVIDCGTTEEDIRNAIKKLYSKKFQAALKKTINPYGKGNAAKRIKKVLKGYQLNGIVKKSFYDIDFNNKGAAC